MVESLGRRRSGNLGLPSVEPLPRTARTEVERPGRQGSSSLPPSGRAPLPRTAGADTVKRSGHRGSFGLPPGALEPLQRSTGVVMVQRPGRQGSAGLAPGELEPLAAITAADMAERLGRRGAIGMLVEGADAWSASKPPVEQTPVPPLGGLLLHEAGGAALSGGAGTPASAAEAGVRCPTGPRAWKSDDRQAPLRSVRSEQAETVSSTASFSGPARTIEVLQGGAGAGRVARRAERRRQSWPPGGTWLDELRLSLGSGGITGDSVSALVDPQRVVSQQRCSRHEDAHDRLLRLEQAVRMLNERVAALEEGDGLWPARVQSPASAGPGRIREGGQSSGDAAAAGRVAELAPLLTPEPFGEACGAALRKDVAAGPVEAIRPARRLTIRDYLTSAPLLRDDNGSAAVHADAASGQTARHAPPLLAVRGGAMDDHPAAASVAFISGGRSGTPRRLWGSVREPAIRLNEFHITDLFSTKNPVA